MNNLAESPVKTIEELRHRLTQITNSMRVPSYNKTKIDWLLRNLQVYNSQHKDFNEAIEICKNLKKMGVH